MVWIILLLIIIVSSFCYLLFAPFYLEIDSSIGLCRIRFHKLANAKLYISKSSLIVDLEIAGWRKQIDLLSEKPSKEVSLKKELKKKGNYISLKKIKTIIKSFKVNKFNLTLCFNNMPLDGIAYPVFGWLSAKTGKRFEINFWNENEIILEVENNFFRMLRAYIKS